MGMIEQYTYNGWKIWVNNSANHARVFTNTRPRHTLIVLPSLRSAKQYIDRVLNKGDNNEKSTPVS